VKGDPQEDRCDEEVVHAAVLANSAEPDTYLDGILDRYADTVDLALCALAPIILRHFPRYIHYILGSFRH